MNLGVIMDRGGHMDRTNVTRQDIKKVKHTGTLPYFNKVDVRNAKTVPDLKAVKLKEEKSKFDGTYRIINKEEQNREIR